MFGDVGSGAMSNMTRVRFIDTKSATFIIKVSRDFYREVLFAVSCITQLKGTSVTIRCLRKCSTARTCISAIKSMLCDDGVTEGVNDG